MKIKRDDIFTVIIVLIIFSLAFVGNPTGLITINNQNKVNFEDLPRNIELEIGKKFALQINKLNVEFSDDTYIFEISKDGLIDFTPKEKGLFRVAIIAMDKDENVEVKVIRFNIA